MFILRGVHPIEDEHPGVALQLFGQVQLQGQEQGDPLPQTTELGHFGDDIRSQWVDVTPEEVAACQKSYKLVLGLSHVCILLHFDLGIQQINLHGLTVY